MIIWPDMEQQSEAWFRARAGRPTASMFSNILSPTGKESIDTWLTYATALTAQCINPRMVPTFTGNRHTDRGNELEPIAREEFARIMGLETVQVGFITRDDEIVGCSPDSLVRKPMGKEFIAGLEIKCPNGEKHHADWLANKLPDVHKPQVHGSMAVTGLRFWYFISYSPGFPPLIVRNEWDEYTDKMSDALDRFLIFYAETRKEQLEIYKQRGAA